MEVARAYVSNLPAGKLLYWIISQLNYAALVSHLSFCSKMMQHEQIPSPIRTQARRAQPPPE
ncbi:hypothetical protein NC653_038465 [Populus alba x Populus x berolinensis]|uniref:Uncharacterized protein n=1 Tax=Populus alba x Populus x berolinensis TaxID=444605 RepID=A0AAD6LGR4_9ROSI|nr:hypothetical protein NC653_038465 [Populus alba x Populus x berolinensis]